ncbi:unnamed protein product [Lepeophtheirus salmonis]|uniref:(salmon louse) hypothetical protein n=1 Tax=Lepeophtheirus salmonis TaxID=72036 RepID=A0A7R8H2T3_LEPSM|nr:unnamed protein product [Lepeophtheirus salmonis]CAF2829347.1 unnamed protein product [Lepeophtheirus salmonis]
MLGLPEKASLSEFIFFLPCPGLLEVLSIPMIIFSENSGPISSKSRNDSNLGLSALKKVDNDFALFLNNVMEHHTTETKTVCNQWSEDGRNPRLLGPPPPFHDDCFY